MYESTTASGARVVVKVPSDKNDGLKQARNEYAILSLLKHPNIVNLLDSFEDKRGHLNIVLERIAGSTLEDAKKHEMSGLLKRRVLHELALGVSYLSNVGVCHRDLKPENIMLTEKLADSSEDRSIPYPLVKIVDFGLADMDRSVYCPRGMQIYHAPEGLYPSDEHLDCTSSMVFILGTIFYEVLEGYNPFHSSSEDVVVMKVATAAVDLSWYADNDPLMADLLSRMFEVDWMNRISIQDVAKHEALASYSGIDMNDTTGNIRRSHQ